MDYDERGADIAGFEGLYQISTYGRVRALRHRNRWIDKLRDEPKIIRTSVASNYLRVGLRNIAPMKTFLVHRLVLSAFGPPRPPHSETGHIDGNPLNNRIENLTWVTKKENARHRAVHGTQQVGSRCYNAKLTPENVLEIRALHRIEKQSDLAARFCVARSTIQRIQYGSAWGHV